MHKSTSLLPRAAAAIAGATLIAACGGSGSHASTQLGGSGMTSINGHPLTIAVANQDVRRFAACMKSHGVAGLPDPVSAPGAFKHSLTGATPNFQSGMIACGHLLPGQEQSSQGPARTRQQVDAMLAFARCIRGHGFGRFPDPTSTGNVTHEMLTQAGIDLHQPAVVQAADACVNVTHGLLTRVDVARFIAGG
jgi:hypothetical protein